MNIISQQKTAADADKNKLGPSHLFHWSYQRVFYTYILFNNLIQISFCYLAILLLIRTLFWKSHNNILIGMTAQPHVKFLDGSLTSVFL